MNSAEYWQKLDALIDEHSEAPGGVPADTRAYLDGHFPRFEALLSLAQMVKEPVYRVLDIGTAFPFVTYWFYLKGGAKVIFGCPIPDGRSIDHYVQFERIDACCRPPLAPADFVQATEVLEHLPCDIYKTINWLDGLTNYGGHLLLSFPLGGVNARNYTDEMPDLYGKPHNGHIREFTGDTAQEFIDYSECEEIARIVSRQPLYGAPILNVLLRKSTWT